MSLDEGIAEFLAALASERGLAANTLTAYRRDLAAYRSFLDERGQTVHTVADAAVTALVRLPLHNQGG